MTIYRQLTWRLIIGLLILLCGPVLLAACNDRTLIRESYAGPVPAGAQARLGKGAVRDLAYTPDHTQLVVGDAVGITLYDTTTFEEVWLAAAPGRVDQVAVSPDGQWVIGGLNTGSLVVIRAADGELTQVVPGFTEGIGVTSLAWQPGRESDNLLAAGYNNGTAIMALVTETDITLQTILDRQPSGVTAIDFQDSGRVFVTATRTGEIYLWDSETGLLLAGLEGHESGRAVTALDWNPAGNRLVSTDNSGTVIEWDVAQFSPLQMLDGAEDGLLDAAYLADGNRFVVAGETGTLTTWETGSNSPATSAELTPDPAAVATAWSADRSQMAVAALTGEITLWPLADGVPAIEPAAILKGHPAPADWVTSLSWNPAGDQLAASLGHEMIIWDTEKQSRLYTLTGHEAAVSSVAWSPDGEVVASGDKSGRIMLWEAGTGRRIRSLTGHTRPVTDLDWSPDSSQLASAGSTDDTVLIWNVDTAQVLHTLKGETNGLWSVGWSPDGNTLATGGSDGQLLLWDAQAPFTVPDETLWRHLNWISGIQWSLTGDTLVTGGAENVVILWTMPEGRAVILPGHMNPVRSVDFNPAGDRALSASRDGVVIVWDATPDSNHEIIALFTGHTEGANAVAWSPAGDVIASGSDDGTILLWPAGD